MFLPLILICNVDYSICEVETSTVLSETAEECVTQIIEGINIFTNEGYIVVDYKCLEWDNPVFDEKI